jgi:hypothetical protein
VEQAFEQSLLEKVTLREEADDDDNADGVMHQPPPGLNRNLHEAFPDQEAGESETVEDQPIAVTEDPALEQAPESASTCEN